MRAQTDTQEATLQLSIIIDQIYLFIFFFVAVNYRLQELNHPFIECIMKFLILT